MSLPNQDLVDKAIHKLGLSGRGGHRTLGVVRTIADIAGAEEIETIHLMEALSYRQLERYTAV
ncbi:MAG: hypothetical protein ACR2RL_20155 [Gammaproteobacteria bacterium]